MRDAAGELADRFHLLRLVELALEPLAVGQDGRQLRLAFPQRFRCRRSASLAVAGMPAKPFPPSIGSTM